MGLALVRERGYRYLVPHLRIATVANDFDATLSFYRQTLGLTVAARWDDPDGRGVMLNAHDAIIEVLEANEHHPFVAPVGVTVAIERQDVDQLYDQIQLAGVDIVDTLADRPWGERSFTVLAPNGLTLNLFATIAGQS